jgi:hypothetical protein
MNARTCAFGALAAIAVVAPLRPLGAASPQPSSGPSSHLVFAVVRTDGLLLPFAAFDGRKWSTPWPDEIGGSASPDLPVNIASVPLKWWGGEEPGPWNLWPREGDTAARIALQSPVMMRVGLSRLLGFRTDRPPVPPAVPPFVLPFPKIGVAIAGEAKLEPISSVSSLTPQWKTFAASLREAIDRAEERSIQTLQSSARWRHPFKREARMKVQPELEAWYVTRLVGTSSPERKDDPSERSERATRAERGRGAPASERVGESEGLSSSEKKDSTVNLSYIEAVKKYPLLPDDQGCGLETFVSGWVHHENQQQNPRAKLKAAVTYCDRRGVSYMLPFGQLQLAGKTHWIVQMSGQDHEWYTVIEGRADEVKYVAEYQAGRLIFIQQ